MKSRQTDMGYLISIEPGEDIIATLTDFVGNKGIGAGALTLIGAVSVVELGYYNLTLKQYHWKKFTGMFEIVSAMGNIAWLIDEPIVHLHGVFSDTDFATFAGHIRSATVSAACEVMLTVHSDRLERKFDEKTGLNLWDCGATKN